MKYRLIYINNFSRITIDTFECNDDPKDKAQKILLEHGYSCENGNFFFKDNENSEIIDIFYSEIISPNNAAGLFEKDGFNFIIHTDEKNHLNTPHVHVIWSNGNISVQLEDLKVVRRKYTKPNEERKAIKIIKEYREYFIAAWNAIMIEEDTDKAYAIFKKLK